MSAGEKIAWAIRGMHIRSQQLNATFSTPQKKREKTQSTRQVAATLGKADRVFTSRQSGVTMGNKS